MIAKYAIANVAIADVARLGQETGIGGSAWIGTGFGEWGIEPTVFLEIVGGAEIISAADKFVRKLLFQNNEQYALRTIDGKDTGLLYVVTGEVKNV